MPKSSPFRNLIGRIRDRKTDDASAPAPQTSNSSLDTNKKTEYDEDGEASEICENSKKDASTGSYGLFPLHESKEEDEFQYTVDIVAVHGLGGNAYKTWTHSNGKLWLRDLLLEDLPNARVFTYGYNSAFVFSRETSTIRQFARALLEDIRSVRRLPEVNMIQSGKQTNH